MLPYKYGVILRAQHLIQPCRALGGGLPAEPRYRGVTAADLKG